MMRKYLDLATENEILSQRKNDVKRHVLKADKMSIEGEQLHADKSV